jgi:protein-S-isoprenylcysteine O-methyltransferase Ste14
MQVETHTPKEKKQRKLGQTAQGFAFAALLLATLFGSAGRANWIRGWIFVGLWMLGMIAGGLTIRRFNPSLLQARAKWRRSDTKPFDKIFLAAFIPLIYVQLAVAGLDAVRYRWSALPFAWTYVGAGIFVLATLVITWALATNPHAESTVRIQTDRGHTVITSGPYRFVRHPMYVGTILMYVAAPLVLGSLWAFVVGAVIVGLFVWRTSLEDRTLRAELAGYEQYTARTPYRLFPGIWY